MRPTVRWLLLLQLAAMAAATSTLLLGVGLPLLARRALAPGAFVVLVLASSIATLVVGAVLLERSVARPVERLILAARRAGTSQAALDLPVLGEPEGHGLSRAAVAFERLAGALVEERRELAVKVEELTVTNRTLGEARESLLRSERLATVGRLAAGLAHEIGNPLGAVTGFVAIAQARVGPGGDPVLADALERIDAASSRIDRIIRELLEFSRPAPPRFAQVSLREVVEASLRLASVQPRFREVAVHLDLAAGLPRIWTDEHVLSQVLLNIFLNAGDATGGAGNVRVVGRCEGPDGPVRLEVEDDGAGIAEADLPRVFDPFFTTKAPGEGCGLGLAVSHGLMASLRGQISAANRPGGGAVFMLILPAHPPPDPEAA